jgi:hypothetical protein
MDNSYFLLTTQETPITIERFHICSWEFRNSSSLIEFGCEIDVSKCDKIDFVSLELYIPWLTNGCIPKDLYNSLKESPNSKFIFNDSVNNTLSLDGGQNSFGVIHEFSVRNKLCILPIKIIKKKDRKALEINIDLTRYHNLEDKSCPNIYFRFYLEPIISAISTRKTGINKSTIIYDIKINERRNLPEIVSSDMTKKKLCRISSCFCLNVVPNSYDLTFLDTISLRNVRTLEYDSFNRYLSDKRVEKDELIVVFNKKIAKEDDENPSFAFFSIFYKERIGAGQFALAVFINLICGILLFIPAFRESNHITNWTFDIIHKLPPELYLAIGIGLLLLLYFIYPILLVSLNSLIYLLKSLKKER